MATVYESIKIPVSSDLKQYAQDRSEYIEGIYKAKQEAEQNALRQAYEKNLAEINRAGQGIDQKYQHAKNQATAASEQNKRNFQEYAAATGINNGAAGQAELARSITLQNNLNDLNRQKADYLAELELRRANADIDYNYAIAQAQAQGDADKAQALYDEKVRYDQQKANYEQQEFQNALNRYQLEQERQKYIDQLAMQYNKNAGTTSWGGTGGSVSYGGSGNTGSTGSSVGYNNGKLTSSQVMQLQAALGVEQDGFYGPATSKAAGGVSADALWASLDGDKPGAGAPDTFFNEYAAKMDYKLKNGYLDAAQQDLNAVWADLTIPQRYKLLSIFKEYGYGVADT